MKTKLTPDDIEALIVHEAYLNLGSAVARTDQEDTEAMHRTVLCMLTLKNGFMVTGQGSCVHLENYNFEIGKSVARENAVNEIWRCEGYLLRQRLHEAGEAAK